MFQNYQSHPFGESVQKLSKCKPPYSSPSLTKFIAERCNAAGTVAQTDGTRVRVSADGAVYYLNSKNSITCTVYYKLASVTVWTTAGILTASNYSVNVTNQLLT